LTGTDFNVCTDSTGEIAAPCNTQQQQDQHAVPSVEVTRPKTVLFESPRPNIPANDASTPQQPASGLGLQWVQQSFNLSPDALSMPKPLPSLLRYVDNHLMRRSIIHNRPPGAHAACNICYKLWNAPVSPSHMAAPLDATTQYSVATTFLPLEPCGHWVHYNCLIWLTTRGHDDKDKCPACGVQLFQWEGITALTLATRTNLNIEMMMSGACLQPGVSCTNAFDMTEYKEECSTIESIIHAHFFVHIGKPASNADGSPDLVQCFYDVLNALQRMGKPHTRWLRYSTMTGYALWCALVAIKMRRYLLEGHNKIHTTEAWTQFEDGRKVLQNKILVEVHR
jgi:hypothetical protein